MACTATASRRRKRVGIPSPRASTTARLRLPGNGHRRIRPGITVQRPCLCTLGCEPHAEPAAAHICWGSTDLTACSHTAGYDMHTSAKKAGSNSDVGCVATCRAERTSLYRIHPRRTYICKRSNNAYCRARQGAASPTSSLTPLPSSPPAIDAHIGEDLCWAMLLIVILATVPT